MSLVIIFTWVLFSIFMGVIGSNRKIGFFGAFLISLCLTPLVGFAFTMTSKDKEVDAMEQQIFRQTRDFNRYNKYQSRVSNKLIILGVIIFALLIAMVIFFLNMYL